MGFSMNFETFSQLLTRSFAQNGVGSYITAESARKFYDLTCIMDEKNRVMNITAIREVEDVIPLHYADCAKIAHLFPRNATVIDVGCGGGFPTLPLAIVRPDLCITGVDSTEKKVRYVQETANALGLNVKTLAGRAEELAQNPQYREKFDCATSRAVARGHILSELCLPFVKIGGKWIIMKGASGQEELDEAENGIRTLGGGISAVAKETLYVKDRTESRVNAVVEKNSETPPKYPRAFGQIKKKPL